MPQQYYDFSFHLTKDLMKSLIIIYECTHLKDVYTSRLNLRGLRYAVIDMKTLKLARSFPLHVFTLEPLTEEILYCPNISSRYLDGRSRPA